MYMNPNRVEFDLKPHNEQTIKRILEFYKTSNKCCAIQATGTGKTFLILRLLEIFNDMNKRAVIFAPNNEIIEQTQSKMREFGLDNVCFYTYQKLAKMSERELCEITADLIVCDEMHRTGAKIWGTKFEEFMKYHKDSKLFGATATPVRCSDGKDMAEEYFDGNRACNISLAEALVRGIIPVMPTYVSAMYTFDEECKNMEDKIKRAKNSDEEKKSLLNELKAAKQQLEKSCGVPEIIKKYITKYNGKYVVFCKNKKHLFKMKDVVIKWFRDAGYDGVIYDYAYYSNDIMVKCNYEKFKNNCKDGLKLLFVIEKLNEGVHPKNIDGGILLRTTSSNIVYYQQIGRIIDAGCNEKRVILDLVCNFNNLKNFSLKDELQEKIEERSRGMFSDCSVDFDVREFYIYDHVQNCIDMLNSLDKKIFRMDYSFNSGMQHLIEYKKTHNSANPDSRYKSKDGFALGSWCFKIKKLYKGEWKWESPLTSNQIAELRKIGFVFDKESHKWEHMYSLVKKYCEENNVNINMLPTEFMYQEENIGSWVSYNKGRLNINKIDLHKKEKLLALGLCKSKSEYIFNEVIKEIQELGGIAAIKRNQKSKKLGINLYDFIITRKKNRDKLSDYEYETLKELGLCFDSGKIAA